MNIIKIKFIKKEKEFEIETSKATFTILESTFVKYNLYANMEIDDDLIYEIKREDKIYRAVNIALRFLRNRKTEFEIRNKLKSENIDNIIIDETINYLINIKYIDDLEYSIAFANDKLKINKYGPEKIKLSLLSKGVNVNTIKKVISNLPNEIIYENCKNAALKKLETIKDSKILNEKLIRHLLYKGYDYNLIKNVIKELV